MASVDIDVDGDTVLQTVEYDSTIVYQAGDKKIPKETCAYKVSRAVLTQHSKVFERMLAVPWHDSSQPVIEVEDSVEYMEVILRVLHKTSPIPRMDTKDLWLLVDHLDYYNLDIQLFESYVQNCSKILITYSLLCAREWVFLTWRFNAAKVFAKLTKIMAYSNVGHIQEKNPTELYHLHLPPRIIRESFFYPRWVTAASLTHIRAIERSQRTIAGHPPSRIVRSQREAARGKLQMSQGDTL